MHLVYSTSFFYLKKHMYVKIALIQMSYKCNFKKIRLCMVSGGVFKTFGTYFLFL